MNTIFLFCIAFVTQIAAVSYFKLRISLNNIYWVFENCPEGDYPKLYPRPRAEYQRIFNTFRYVQLSLILIGFFILFALQYLSISIEYYHVASTAYFFLQATPFTMLDTALKNEFKLMAKLGIKQSRSASLRPRNIFDYFPASLLIACVAIYVLFVIFVGIVNEYGFSWFGGWVNIIIITMMNLFFVALAYRIVYSKKINPYEAEDDRAFEIKSNVKSLVIVSIAATLFAMLSIAISISGYNSLKPTAFSLYFTLLGLLSFRSYRFDYMNLSNYKSDVLKSNSLN